MQWICEGVGQPGYPDCTIVLLITRNDINNDAKKQREEAALQLAHLNENVSPQLTSGIPMQTPATIMIINNNGASTEPFFSSGSVHEMLSD